MRLSDEDAHDQLRDMALASDESEQDGLAQTASNSELLDQPVRAPPMPDEAQAASGTATTLSKPPEMPQTPRPAPFDTSKPLGYSPQDDELKGLQDKAADSKRMAGLGKAVTDFTERPDHFLGRMTGRGSGGGGQMAHNSMWEDSAASGDKAVSDLMARRKSESDMAAKQGAAAKAAEMSDPKSQRAMTYRAVLAKFAPDLAPQLEAATPEQMEKIAPWLEKYGDEVSKQKAAKAAPADKSAAVEAELKAEREGLKIDYPDRAKDIDSLGSKEAIKNFRLNNEGRLGRATTIDAAKIAAGTTRAEARDVRAGAKADKADEAVAEQTIPGLTHDPKVRLDKAEVQNIRSAHADAEVMKGLIAELDGLIEKNGLEILPGPDKVRMQTLLRQLQLKAKGPAFAQLGVLSGPDLAILEDLTGDPTDWKSLFKGGAEGVRTRLGVFNNTLQSGLDNAEKTHGYSKDAKVVPGETAPAGRVHVIDESGANITLPADQVDDYLKDFPKARKAE